MVPRLIHQLPGLCEVTTQVLNLPSFKEVGGPAHPVLVHVLLNQTQLRVEEAVSRFEVTGEPFNHAELM